MKGRTGTFALFALWTHTTVHRGSGICHTLHSLRTGVVLTQVVLCRTFTTCVSQDRQADWEFKDKRKKQKNNVHIKVLPV